MDTKGKGLLYEMKNGYPITMSEEEYKAKEKEIRSIASDLYVNMDVLDLVEKDYKLKLLVLSMASYFGFDRATGEDLLQAAHLTCPAELNPMKYFFMKAGWTPYYWNTPSKKTWAPTSMKSWIPSTPTWNSTWTCPNTSSTSVSPTPSGSFEECLGL